MEILGYFIFCTVLAIVGGVIAQRKRRSVFLWSFLGFCLPFALLILLALAPNRAPEPPVKSW